MRKDKVIGLININQYALLPNFETVSQLGLLLRNPDTSLHLAPGTETNCKSMTFTVGKGSVSIKYSRVASTTYAVNVALQLKNRFLEKITEHKT